MQNNYLVINKSVDPYYNLALEEYLLTHYTQGFIIMLWQNDNTIVVGRNQNTIEEINQQYVKEHEIKVVRRMTGGGAVYHDLGNLNYSFITDKSIADNYRGLQEFSGPVIKTLRSLGVNADFSGRNDIMVEGRKVSGTAQRLYKNRILHHGCLLFNSNLSVVSKSLNVRAEKLQSKAIKSVRSHVGNIMDYLDVPITLEEFEKCLIDTILENKKYQVLELNDKELEDVQNLRNRKYASWEWNYGNAMICSIHNYKRYSGGSIDVYVDVQQGLIHKCLIFGDFMSLCPISDIEQALTGCRYQYKDVLDILNKFRVSDYFGGLRKEEIATTICLIEE